MFNTIFTGNFYKKCVFRQKTHVRLWSISLIAYPDRAALVQRHGHLGFHTTIALLLHPGVQLFSERCEQFLLGGVSRNVLQLVRVFCKVVQFFGMAMLIHPHTLGGEGIGPGLFLPRAPNTVANLLVVVAVGAHALERTLGVEVADVFVRAGPH